MAEIVQTSTLVLIITFVVVYTIRKIRRVDSICCSCQQEIDPNDPTPRSFLRSLLGRTPGRTPRVTSASPDVPPEVRPDVSVSITPENNV